MKKTIYLLLVAALFTFSCKKDPGPAGPAGPQGAAGNANVKNYSVTVHPSDWIYSSTYQEWHFNFSCTDNLNSAVLGYVMSGNGEQALPYVYTTGNCRYTMATDLFQTVPYIQFQFTNFTAYTTAPTADQYFYLVIIPPALKKPGVNYNSYASIKDAYNLK